MTDTMTNGATIQSITRHPEYYISGGDLSILVEHTQFRVHRYFFERESTWFKDQLVQPAAPGTSPQGSSDANSFILESLIPAQFAKFLWVFYNPRYSLYDASLEDWETILRLSERWKFPEVKSLAIRELEKKDITDVKRIKLYHENNVDRNLLIPRYAALCEREEPLTYLEGQDLGMETSFQIFTAREQARASLLPSGARSPSTPTVRGDDLRDIIRELFKITASPSTTEESSQNTGALKPPPKTEPLTKPQPLAKKSTEKAKNQQQDHKKGKKTGQATTTPKDTTPPPVEKPQPPTKEETKSKTTKRNENGDDPNPGSQTVVDPAETINVDSGSATTPLNPAAGADENITDIPARPPLDAYSHFSLNNTFSPQSVFGDSDVSLI